MPFFNTNILAITRENRYFRKEVLTGEHSQLVIMSIEPGDDIGEETHDVDQVLVFVAGQGEAVVDGERGVVTTNSLVVVPAGARHNFINTGTEPLKLFTVYAPPEEARGTLHRTRAEAMEAEHH